MLATSSIKKDGRFSEPGAKYHIVYEAIAGNDDIHNTLAQWINERPWYDVMRVKDDLSAIEPCDPAHHEPIRLRAESWADKRCHTNLNDIKRPVEGTADDNFERGREGDNEVVLGHVSSASVMIAARKEHEHHRDYCKCVRPDRETEERHAINRRTPQQAPKNKHHPPHLVTSSTPPCKPQPDPPTPSQSYTPSIFSPSPRRNITRRREHQSFQPIADHLIDMAEHCPHHLFQTTIGTDNRASQGKAAFNLDSVEIKAKRNHACRIADLVLQTVTNNKRRHDEIQRFMLITDSVTVAVEVPIILTPEDIADMQRQLGFHTQKLHLDPKSP